jgi:hypothetical protein
VTNQQVSQSVKSIPFGTLAHASDALTCTDTIPPARRCTTQAGQLTAQREWNGFSSQQTFDNKAVPFFPAQEVHQFDIHPGVDLYAKRYAVLKADINFQVIAAIHVDAVYDFSSHSTNYVESACRQESSTSAILGSSWPINPSATRPVGFLRVCRCWIGEEVLGWSSFSLMAPIRFTALAFIVRHYITWILWRTSGFNNICPLLNGLARSRQNLC